MVRLQCSFLLPGFSLPAAGLSGRRLLLSHQFVGKDTPAASGAGPGRADESAVPLTEATVPLSLMNRFVVSVRCAALGVKCFSLKDCCAGQRVQCAGERRAPCRFRDWAQTVVVAASFRNFCGCLVHNTEKICYPVFWAPVKIPFSENPR